MNAEVNPRILEGHVHVAGYRGGALSYFRVREFKAAARASESNVKRFATEIIDQWPTLACHDTRNFNARGPRLEVRLQLDWQKQGIAEISARGGENREQVA